MSVSFAMTPPTRVQLLEAALQFQGALSFALLVMMTFNVLGIVEFKDRCPGEGYSRCQFVSDCRSFLCSVVGIILSRACDFFFGVAREPCIGNWLWFERLTTCAQAFW
mmetsp:Transcript_112740/g.318653  ORF Transcript_112740/g.318653 Transcript_112740/m.318653 type:complete len:108 (+) Transcript_112740:47-370(+)